MATSSVTSDNLAKIIGLIESWQSAKARVLWNSLSGIEKEAIRSHLYAYLSTNYHSDQVKYWMECQVIVSQTKQEHQAKLQEQQLELTKNYRRNYLLIIEDYVARIISCTNEEQIIIGLESVFRGIDYRPQTQFLRNVFLELLLSHLSNIYLPLGYNVTKVDNSIILS